MNTTFLPTGVGDGVPVGDDFTEALDVGSELAEVTGRTHANTAIPTARTARSAIPAICHFRVVTGVPQEAKCLGTILGLHKTG